MKSTPRMAKIPPSMTPAELRTWRRSHGLRQPDVAALLGIAQRTYLHYERGNTRSGFTVPTVPRIVELAVKGLDAELRPAILAGDGEPSQP